VRFVAYSHNSNSHFVTDRESVGMDVAVTGFYMLMTLSTYLRNKCSDSTVRIYVERENRHVGLKTAARNPSVKTIQVLL